MPFKKELNLIGTETKKTIKYQRLKKKVRNLVIVLTAVFLMVNVLIVSYFFMMKKKITNNNVRIKLLKDKVANLDKNESYVITITDRVDKISALIKEKKSFLKSITDLDSLTVSGFNLNSLSFDPSGNLKLTASCDNNQSLTDFNERLERASLQGLFSNIIYSSIGRSRIGKYDFSLELKK